MIKTADTKITPSGEQALTWLQSAITRFFLVCMIVVLPVAALIFMAVPIAYNTIHVPDTFFLADLGWRVTNGLDPVLDFGHFYGGVVAYYIATAFALFGTSLKSIDYAFGLMAATLIVLGLAMSWRRLSGIGTLALCMLLASCLLARVPLEMLTAIQRPTSSHAFVYNRVAISVTMILMVFAMVPSRVRTLDAGMAVLGGALCYGLALIKPTFVVFTPFFFAVLAVQKRWTVLGAAIFGLIVAVLVLDFGALRVSEAFSYGVAAASGNTTIPGMVLKCFAVFLVQPLSLCLALLIVVALIHQSKERGWRMFGSTLLLGAGFAGMTATMGWLGDVGQQALPFFAVIALTYSETFRKHDIASAEMRAVVQITTLALVLAFSLPQLAQTSISGLVASLRQPLIETTETPLDHYLGWSDELTDPDGRTMSTGLSWNAQIAAAIAHLESGKDGNAGTDYIHLVDAARLLQQIPPDSRHGIAGDMNGLAYVMQSPPVGAFPVWVNTTAPELAPGTETLSNVEIMMIRRVAPQDISLTLQDLMASSFRACLQTPLWTLSIRRDLPSDFCDMGPIGPNASLF